MFTVDPLQPSSSVSHFDRSLRRDAIMEPVASLDLHYDLTLETAVMRDMGWPMICGNGQLDGTEECDNGAANSDTVADACRNTCKNASCGDGAIDTGEECDPPGGEGPDGTCHEGCRLSFCGDGEVNPGELCDNAGANSDTVPDACRSTCQPAGCGDGVVDTGEACDEVSAACSSCVLAVGAGGAGGAGVGGAAGTGVGAMAGAPPVAASKKDEGCGCRSAGSTGSASYAWLGLLALAGFRRRRASLDDQLSGS
jgi:MYXO-CTERM domain-containing protein